MNTIRLIANFLGILMTHNLFYKCIAGLLIAISMNSAFATDIECLDPLEPLNRATFYLNQMAFALYIKPAVRAYDAAIPLPVRGSVHNFIVNMRTVYYAANGVFQGNFPVAIRNAARVVINSTLGIFGLFDVATPMGIKMQKETLGNTLYRWGWKESSYFVIPIVGPSTIRDTWGIVGDYYMGPPAYFTTKWRNYYYAIDLLDVHSDIKDIHDLMAIAGVNDYDFVRSTFLQHRQFDLTGEQVSTLDSNGNNMLGEPPA